jgi:DNA-binding transcriptional LysR family regulator
MELRHLRYVVAVADAGSFSRAATQLHVAQPALSRQVRALERELGERLFERTRAGVTVTAAGAALIGHARQLLALAAATPDVLADCARHRELVSVGLPPGIRGDWLLDVTRQLRTAVPRCAVRYLEAGSAEQLRLLARGSLDVAIVHQVPADGHVSRLLSREPLGVAVRPDHPLAERTTCQLSDLDGMRVLVHSRDQVPAQQDGVLTAAMAAGIQPAWIFARFVEHARPAAEAADADAVLLGSHTAARQLDDWSWRPIEGLELAMTTWVVRRADTRAGVAEVADTIAAMGVSTSAARVSSDDLGDRFPSASREDATRSGRTL